MTITHFLFVEYHFRKSNIGPLIFPLTSLNTLFSLWWCNFLQLYFAVCESYYISRELGPWDTAESIGFYAHRQSLDNILLVYLSFNSESTSAYHVVNLYVAGKVFLINMLPIRRQWCKGNDLWIIHTLIMQEIATSSVQCFDMPVQASRRLVWDFLLNLMKV